MSLSFSLRNLLRISGVVLIATGVGLLEAAPVEGTPGTRPTTPPSARSTGPDALAIIASPHVGTDKLDEQIRRAQKQVAAAPDAEVPLLRLGHLFIGKARLSNDPGYYKLAEQCAVLIERAHPDYWDAWLLRGHALAAMHQFTEAETIARRLIAVREYVLDHALLGDALMEQGRLTEAIPAYQQMADLKPGLQAYTRISHVRWLKGDLEGASEMMKLAIESGTPRVAEPMAWASTRLGAYRLQAGNFAEAHQLCARALQLVPEYAPALLMQGRVFLAEKKVVEAIAPLKLAAERNPLPEVQWVLADVLREAGETERALEVEKQLEARGANTDPRSYSLYLATRGIRAEEALRMAQNEMEDRRDIFTYDALAWAQYASGQTAEAAASIERALSEGTQDARLFLHAGVILGGAAKPDEARGNLLRADALRTLLFPSERDLLDRQLSVHSTATTDAGGTSLTSNQTNKNQKNETAE